MKWIVECAGILNACPRLIASGFDAAIAVNSLHFPPDHHQFERRHSAVQFWLHYADAIHPWYTSSCSKLIKHGQLQTLWLPVSETKFKREAGWTRDEELAIRRLSDYNYQVVPRSDVWDISSRASYYDFAVVNFDFKMTAEAKLLKNIDNPSAISFLINKSFDENEVDMS